jgi:hypothetical protein
VKRRLLGFRPLYQFPDPIEHSLIGDSGRHALVMLDLAVEFDALLTHQLFLSSKKTDQRPISSID